MEFLSRICWRRHDQGPGAFAPGRSFHMVHFPVAIKEKIEYNEAYAQRRLQDKVRSGAVYAGQRKEQGYENEIFAQ